MWLRIPAAWRTLTELKTIFSEEQVCIRANVEGRILVVISYLTLLLDRRIRCSFYMAVFEEFDFSKNFERVRILTKGHDLRSCYHFWISCLEMLETSVLGLGQDIGLLLVLEGAMTNSTYVSRFSFILIPYWFKVRDRFLAYTTCMVGTEHLSKDNFKPSWKC
ncbi:hypothetical protein DY000_02006710 [Brassica cretica]|uniref:Uncharacterized protein n=1 Tax=Brassica cretica TaxID=69181 RepID=A0ABQ7BTW6_BRACR|nr:hypothetical protein DY000_02006710 [Brassica cretica]